MNDFGRLALAFRNRVDDSSPVGTGIQTISIEFPALFSKC